MTKQDILQFIELIRGKNSEELFGCTYDEASNSFDTEDDFKWSSSSEIMKEVFKRGNCGNFGKILKTLIPDGEIKIIYKLTSNESKFLPYHVVFEYEDILYDITGEVTNEFNNSENYSINEANDLLLEDFTNNYSFSDRGPII